MKENRERFSERVRNPKSECEWQREKEREDQVNHRKERLECGT